MSSFLTDIRLNNLQRQINSLESDVEVLAAAEGVTLPISEPLNMMNNAIQNVSEMTLVDGGGTSTLAVSGGELQLDGNAVGTTQTISKSGQTVTLSDGGGSVSLNPTVDVDMGDHQLVNVQNMFLKDYGGQVVFKDDGNNPIALKWDGSQGLEIDGDSVVVNPLANQLDCNDENLINVSVLSFTGGKNLHPDSGTSFGSSHPIYGGRYVLNGWDSTREDEGMVLLNKPMVDVRNIQFNSGGTKELSSDGTNLTWNGQIIHTGETPSGGSAYQWTGDTDAENYSLNDLKKINFNPQEDGTFSATSNLSVGASASGEVLRLDATNEVNFRIGDADTNDILSFARWTKNGFILSRPNTEVADRGPLALTKRDTTDQYSYLDASGSDLLFNGVSLTTGGASDHALVNVASITFNDDSVLESKETDGGNELVYDGVGVVTSANNWTGQYNILKLNETIDIEANSGNTRCATSEFNWTQLNQYGRYLAVLKLTFSFNVMPFIQNESGHSKLSINLFSCTKSDDLNASGQDYYQFLSITDPFNGIKWTGNTGTVTVQLPNWQNQTNPTYTAYKFNPTLLKQLTGGAAGLTAIVATVVGEASDLSGSCILQTFVGQWLTPVEAGASALANPDVGMIQLGDEEPEYVTPSSHHQLVLSQKSTGQTTTNSAVVVGSYKVPLDKCGVLSAQVWSENSCFRHDMFVKNEDGVVSRTVLKTETLHNPDGHVISSAVDSATNQIEISATGKANTIQNWGCRFFFDSIARYIQLYYSWENTVSTSSTNTVRLILDSATSASIDGDWPINTYKAVRFVSSSIDPKVMGVLDGYREDVSGNDVIRFWVGYAGFAYSTYCDLWALPSGEQTASGEFELISEEDGIYRYSRILQEGGSPAMFIPTAYYNTYLSSVFPVGQTKNIKIFAPNRFETESTSATMNNRDSNWKRLNITTEVVYTGRDSYTYGYFQILE